ncbi:hypothetical protein E2C01_033143 [Portunus trituberculatus]|uniref:Uncharacterized protein n=1 Tax=Portunus trituberculatus TaxID=210409 RepID=A0A5B7EZD0_PORTR|nr:hypothetical protein [Portunus trituberculatus]
MRSFSTHLMVAGLSEVSCSGAATISPLWHVAVFELTPNIGWWLPWRAFVSTIDLSVGSGRRP